MNKKMKRNLRAGFTLVEAVVVGAVLCFSGLLIAGLGLGIYLLVR